MKTISKFAMKLSADASRFGMTISILLYGLAASTSGQTPTVHPIPSAPKNHYSEASVYALPQLQCKLHPTGDRTTKPLNVFTDDDGYARFYAVQATSIDAVHNYTLDCEDSAGKPHYYSVDLLSEETFAPHPLDLTTERGTDRPALTGDPLAYSQEELLQRGYGLRPDPTKDPEVYAEWLAGASMKGRMLEVKRPSSTSHGVTTTTANPWTGSVLTGAPNYISTQATFNVPEVVPDGDETASGTEIAIWNGLGGFRTGSGLIQGGVGIETSGLVATYSSWREYCCGDGDSNGYGGAFTPKPGEKVFSQEWYCDSNGNLALNGGYGCTFLQDLKTGAVLSCTSPTGKPCWSVKALPLCSADSTVKNCMTTGSAAEFIIENQSPQCCTPSTPFTDLASKVTITGSAYSSTTNAYSQTISNDPAVSLLADFTNTTSHMNVSLGKRTRLTSPSRNSRRWPARRTAPGNRSLSDRMRMDLRLEIPGCLRQRQR